MTEEELKEALLDQGYEDILVLSNYDYADAAVGVSNDGRVIYDYELMVEWLVTKEGFSEEDAREWVDYNTLRALPYMGPDAPIILFPII